MPEEILEQKEHIRFCEQCGDLPIWKPSFYLSLGVCSRICHDVAQLEGKVAVICKRVDMGEDVRILAETAGVSLWRAWLALKYAEKELDGKIVWTTRNATAKERKKIGIYLKRRMKNE